MARSEALRPPSVERLLAAARPRLGAERDHAAVLAAARAVIGDERGRIASGSAPRDLATLAQALVQGLESLTASRGLGLTRVINATGVILHTNLGRAAWPAAAIQAAEAAAGGYSLLELDRASGRRGARFRVAEEHLIALTGAKVGELTR